jgi:hypothetical protein
MAAPETPDRAGLLAASGLFDPVWYLRCNDDVAAAGLDPFGHYVDYGWAEHRWPNRYFDPAWYRLDNPDVAAAGVDPLWHYIRDGDREQRRPHPLFNPAWYRSAYDIPPDAPAFSHFIAHRASGSVAPCPELYAVPLLAPYRDDPVQGRDPIAHYLDDIEASGQEAFPDLPIVRDARLIEDNYYLVNASDVYEANLDPISHYCRFGWREFRKPNIYFDPGWYGETNPQVVRLAINPLVHYILTGEPAGRRPAPFFDPVWYRAEYDVPADQLALSHYLANRRLQTFSPTPFFDVRWYVSRFGHQIPAGRDPFAHYMQAGMTQDIDPSHDFNAANYRQAHLGRPSRGFPRLLKPEQHNPLVHYLRSEYGGTPTARNGMPGLADWA